MIDLLPPNRWPEIRKAFEATFGEDSRLPDPNKANIIVETENGKILSFMIVEMTLRVGQIYSNGGHPLSLLRYANENIPKGASVVTVSDDPRFDNLCKKFGMTEIKGKLFWLDK